MRADRRADGIGIGLRRSGASIGSVARGRSAAPWLLRRFEPRGASTASSSSLNARATRDFEVRRSSDAVSQRRSRRRLSERAGALGPCRRADVIDVEVVDLIFVLSAVITAWRYRSSRASRSIGCPLRLWWQLRGSASTILTGLPQGDVEGPLEALKRWEQPNWATSTAKSKKPTRTFCTSHWH